MNRDFYIVTNETKDGNRSYYILPLRPTIPQWQLDEIAEYQRDRFGFYDVKIEHYVPEDKRKIVIKNCPHLAPPDKPETSVEKKMFKYAKENKRCSFMWGVVHPGNAICVAVFDKKKEADAYRKDKASAYVVVRVCVTPVYTKG